MENFLLEFNVFLVRKQELSLITAVTVIGGTQL